MQGACDTPPPPAVAAQLSAPLRPGQCAIVLPRMRFLTLDAASPVRPASLWLDSLYIVFAVPDPGGFVAVPYLGIISVDPGEGAVTAWFTRSVIDGGFAPIAAVSVAGRSEAYLFGARPSLSYSWPRVCRPAVPSLTATSDNVYMRVGFWWSDPHRRQRSHRAAVLCAVAPAKFGKRQILIGKACVADVDVRNTEKLAIVVQQRAQLTLRETRFVDAAALSPPFAESTAVLLEDAGFARAGNATFRGARAAESSVRIVGPVARLFDDGGVSRVEQLREKAHKRLTAELNTLFVSEADAPLIALGDVRALSRHTRTQTPLFETHTRCIRTYCRGSRQLRSRRVLLCASAPPVQMLLPWPADELAAASAAAAAEPSGSEACVAPSNSSDAVALGGAAPAPATRGSDDATCRYALAPLVAVSFALGSLACCCAARCRRHRSAATGRKPEALPPSPSRPRPRPTPTSFTSRGGSSRLPPTSLQAMPVSFTSRGGSSRLPALLSRTEPLTASFALEPQGPGSRSDNGDPQTAATNPRCSDGDSVSPAQAPPAEPEPTVRPPSGWLDARPPEAHVPPDVWLLRQAARPLGALPRGASGRSGGISGATTVVPSSWSDSAGASPSEVSAPPPLPAAGAAAPRGACGRGGGVSGATTVAPSSSNDDSAGMSCGWYLAPPPRSGADGECLAPPPLPAVSAAAPRSGADGGCLAPPPLPAVSAAAPRSGASGSSGSASGGAECGPRALPAAGASGGTAVRVAARPSCGNSTGERGVAAVSAAGGAAARVASGALPAVEPPRPVDERASHAQAWR